MATKKTMTTKRDIVLSELKDRILNDDPIIDIDRFSRMANGLDSPPGAVGIGDFPVHTLYFKEIGSKNARLVYFDLQFLMFSSGSFTSRPISDRRLAVRTDLSIRQIERARRILAKSRLVEVKQAFSDQGERVIGTYVYRLRTADEIEAQ